MILVDHEIKKLIDEEKMVENFDIKNLQSVSYDITLNGKINRFKNEFRRIDPRKGEQINNIYEEVDITYGYDLRPNEFILIQMKETLNMPENIVAHIRPRTSFIRLGLVISAQHINPTFTGRLHLGILNASPYVIQFQSGMKLGQLIFEKLSAVPTEENLYKNKIGAKYQNENKFTGSKAFLEMVEKFELKDVIEERNLEDDD